MFTGIITDVGTVVRVEQRGDARFTVRCGYDMAGVAIGASIACSGVCLTVVAKDVDSFTVDASGETLARTSAATWREGTRLNLERALKLGDELGGHIVTGHVDAVGKVASVERDGDSYRVRVEVPGSVAPFIAEKGSVTVDGVSLTVNAVVDQSDGGTEFGLNIIPHTWGVTTLGELGGAGGSVNIEIDVLARYLSRMRDQVAHQPGPTRIRPPV